MPVQIPSKPQIDRWPEETVCQLRRFHGPTLSVNEAESLIRRRALENELGDAALNRLYVDVALKNGTGPVVNTNGLPWVTDDTYDQIVLPPEHVWLVDAGFPAVYTHTNELDKKIKRLTQDLAAEKESAGIDHMHNHRHADMLGISKALQEVTWIWQVDHMAANTRDEGVEDGDSSGIHGGPYENDEGDAREKHDRVDGEVDTVEPSFNRRQWKRPPRRAHEDRSGEVGETRLVMSSHRLTQTRPPPPHVVEDDYVAPSLRSKKKRGPPVPNEV